MAAGKLTYRKVFENEALKIGDVTSISKPITITRKGWFAAMLELAITLTVGTGTGALANGEKKFFKNIRMASDLDGDSKNAPLLALYEYAKLAKGIAAPCDAIAAASATYKVVVPLLFADPLSMVPENTLLDCRRYDTLELNITTGGVADLLGTVGTSSVTALASMTAIETQDDLPFGFSPMFYPVQKAMAAVNHTDLLLKIGRLPDQRLRRFLYLLATSSVAGVPFSGTPADLGITSLSLNNGKGYDMELVSRPQLQADNLADFKVSRSTGFYMVDLMRSGNLDDSAIMHPALRSKCDFEWATDTATATTVNMLLDLVQELKVG